jgi:hypothetical protein
MRAFEQGLILLVIPPAHTISVFRREYLRCSLLPREFAIQRLDPDGRADSAII